MSDSFCNPMDYSPPGFSVLGISQARILKWIATPFYWESSWLRDQTHALHWQVDSLPLSHQESLGQSSNQLVKQLWNSGRRCGLEIEIWKTDWFPWVEEIATGEQEYSKRRGDRGGGPRNITFKVKQSSRVNERRRCNEGQEDATEVKATSQQSHRNIYTCVHTHT